MEAWGRACRGVEWPAVLCAFGALDCAQPGQQVYPWIGRRLAHRLRRPVAGRHRRQIRRKVPVLLGVLGEHDDALMRLKQRLRVHQALPGRAAVAELQTHQHALQAAGPRLERLETEDPAHREARERHASHLRRLLWRLSRGIDAQEAQPHRGICGGRRVRVRRVGRRRCFRTRCFVKDLDRGIGVRLLSRRFGFRWHLLLRCRRRRRRLGLGLRL